MYITHLLVLLVLDQSATIVSVNHFIPLNNLVLAYNIPEHQQAFIGGAPEGSALGLFRPKWLYSTSYRNHLVPWPFMMDTRWIPELYCVFCIARPSLC